MGGDIYREELGGAEEKKAIIRVYYMNKKAIFNKKEKNRYASH